MRASHNARVLILEDDPGVAGVMLRAAVAGGHEARLVTQPDEFFAAIEEWEPTHIVLDLVMPEMDGIQVLAELGARECRAVIILASGMGARVLEAAGRAAREHGLHIAGLLAKPFSRAALRALLAVPADAGDFHRRGPIDPDSVLNEAEFRSALQHRQFRVHYQPRIECSHGRLVGFEALARWILPQGRMIMPDEFIPFAEKHALIDALTDVVLDQALDWFSARFVNERSPSYIAPGAGPQTDISLSINLSALSLHDMQLVDRLLAGCLRHRVPPAKLIFELTETSAMESPVAALDMLTRLRVKGFQLSIDDFGMGHSSMLQLVRMPFTEIKVDKSFVMSATHSDESRTVVKSIVDLGRSLSLKSAAEGVEDAPTLTLLERFGCDFAQGYWIGRPMESDAVPAWMAARRALA